MTYIITEIQIINNKEITVRSDLSSIITHLHDHYNLDTNRMNLLEIGTFLGESTFYFSKYFKHVFTVDNYHVWEGLLDREKRFLDNLDNFNNITKIKMNSEETSSFFKDKIFDILYIDGGHDYFRPEEINKENSSWSTKVTGVFEFIDEFLGDPELVCNTNWLFKKEKIINKNIVQKIKGKQIVNNLTKNRVIINSSPPRIHK